MSATDILTLQHERVDDIPLIIGLAAKLGLPEILDKHLRTHGAQQGLNNGWLAVVWLAFVPSEGDHRKCAVEEWAQRHARTLEVLTGQPLRPVDLADDRLGGLLTRLSKTPAWECIETDLWKGAVGVYQIECPSVRLDATTASGHHTVRTEGIMQRSACSKDHRPDLPQLKLMAAAADASGYLLASDVVSGETGDDLLYTPLAARVRQMLGRTGLLYVGDSKMAALATRAELVAHGDYYLMPLPLKGETGQQYEGWVEAVVEGDQSAALVWDGERLLGAGYEVERQLSAQVDGEWVEWCERVLVTRSALLAKQQWDGLQERLTKAETALGKLTPAPGPGRRQIQTEETLKAAVAAVLERYGVQGLLHVRWRSEPWLRRRRGGRAGGEAPGQETPVRWVVTAIERDMETIEQQHRRLGWRLQATNLPVATMAFDQCIRHYRGGWCLEREFHLVKSRPLGLSPLYVARDDQIIGLTRLLTLALRLYTLIETQVRKGLAEEGEVLRGLYEGQPKRETGRPTAVSLLKAVARCEITLTQVTTPDETRWHLTPLPPLLQRVLTYMRLPLSLYADLAREHARHLADLPER